MTLPDYTTAVTGMDGTLDEPGRFVIDLDVDEDGILYLAMTRDDATHSPQIVRYPIGGTATTFKLLD